jgi:hypothetical protein
VTDTSHRFSLRPFSEQKKSGQAVFAARFLRCAPRLRGCISAGAEQLERRTLLSGLTIVPTFASSITSDAHAAQIEAGINAAVSQLDSLFSNPITVPVLFEKGPGLGSSLSGFDQIPYSQWRSAMVAHATDANQMSAIANLPLTNTINGSDNVEINYANELALGITPASSAKFFGTITLTTGECNLTRTSIDPNKYDLQDLALHELDEVLGIGSILDNVSNGDAPPTDTINPEDFFRYSAGPNGHVDFTTSSRASVFFSIDGGRTDLAQFNQDSTGDFNDWDSIDGPAVTQVQDAFGTPGVIDNYNVEPVVLNVMGFTPTHALGTGIVQGVVFNDANGNGVNDAGEANLSGYTIQAVQNGRVVGSTVSNALQYQLGSLPDGTYTIQAVPLAGSSLTTPLTPYTVTISGHNDTVSGKDFGETTSLAGGSSTISGTVFTDSNGNHVQDAGETGLANVRVYLDAKNAGHFVKTDLSVFTDSSGNYSFASLPAGKFRVRVVTPSGFHTIFPAANAAHKITLTAGAQITGQNFAEKPVIHHVRKLV